MRTDSSDGSTAFDNHAMACRRVLKPVLLATTVFCVAAAIAMSLFGLAAAGRPASSCINEEHVVQAICDLPSIYWYMLAAFIGKPRALRALLVWPQ